MKPPTLIVPTIVFAALLIAGTVLVVIGTSGATAALPPIGAGVVGGALAYFLIEVSAWDRARHSSTR